MTEHERVQAEFKAWYGDRAGEFVAPASCFEAGWLAAKEDSHRTQLIAPEQKPLPTFEEWCMSRYGSRDHYRSVPGVSVRDYLRHFTDDVQLYVTEIARRR